MMNTPRDRAMPKGDGGLDPNERRLVDQLVGAGRVLGVPAVPNLAARDALQLSAVIRASGAAPSAGQSASRNVGHEGRPGPQERPGRYDPLGHQGRPARRDAGFGWGQRPLVRRVAWALAILVLALASAVAFVPGVRARFGEFLRIGSLGIFIGRPTATPGSTPGIGASGIGKLGSGESTATTVRPTRTPLPAPTATASLGVMDLTGRTTLAAARRELPVPVKLPTFPDDLGEPDAVFVQQLMDGEIGVLVWFDHASASPASPSTSSSNAIPGKSGSATGVEAVANNDGRLASTPIRLVLYEFNGDVSKDGFPLTKRLGSAGARWLEETTVGGKEAVWMSAPHELLYRIHGETSRVVRRLVSENVLVWADGAATYHLEGPFDLEMARRIAESVR